MLKVATEYKILNMTETENQFPEFCLSHCSFVIFVTEVFWKHNFVKQDEFWKADG